MLKKKTWALLFGIQLFNCHIESCTNFIHAPCYVNMVTTFNDGILPTYDCTTNDSLNPMFCRKGCYNKYYVEQKDIKQKRRKAENKIKSWNNDGPQANINSMKVLLN